MSNSKKTATGAISFCFGVIAIFIALLVIPSTREIFIALSMQHPYMMGFIKFCLLSTVGDMIGIKLRTKQWGTPKGAVPKAIIWGFLGMSITLMFQIYGGGVTAAMESGYLIESSSKFVFALLVSTVMNLTFAPTMMAFHRITDTIIDLKCDGVKDIKLSNVVKGIDWSGFVTFVILKTIPFFWIPAHTLTFLVPGEYRVILAASLSIALGAILAFANKKK